MTNRLGPDSVGLAMISRDAERTLPRLLDSAAGCFDQVALLDTGSTDSTVAIFEAWAAEQSAASPGFEGRLARVRWNEDFSTARNEAYAMLDTSWKVWADADDEIHGANMLRRIAARAPADVAGVVASYVTDQNRTVGAVCYTRRIRMTRTGSARWVWPVHETLVVDGRRLAEIPAEVVRWVHNGHGGRTEPDPERNLRILRSWLKREPYNRQALAHAGWDEAAHGNHGHAIDYFRRYIGCCREWDNARAQMHRQLALSLIALGCLDEAAQDAACVVAAVPEWPDSYLTLADVALARGDTDAVVAHATKVLELGPPLSALFQVTTDYTAYPRLLIAQALLRAGDPAQSRRFADEVLPQRHTRFQPAM